MPAAASEDSRGSGDFARILAGFGPLPGGKGTGPGSSRADAPAAGKSLRDGSTGPTDSLPLSRRSTLHRDSAGRGSTARGSATGHPPMHGSILAGSTWKQAAAALRSGRRN